MILKTFPDGQVLRDYDPTDEYTESEASGTEFIVRQREKGLTRETAEKKIYKRMESIATRMGYQTFLPCVRCTSCVIVRGMENGEVKNQYYACQKMKMQVERYGTCLNASEGNGPLVLEKNLFVEEALAKKKELMN